MTLVKDKQIKLMTTKTILAVQDKYSLSWAVTSLIHNSYIASPLPSNTLVASSVGIASTGTATEGEQSQEGLGRSSEKIQIGSLNSLTCLQVE